MTRKELIKYIKEKDKKYVNFDFNKHAYSDSLLEGIRKRIDRGEDRKRLAKIR